MASTSTPHPLPAPVPPTADPRVWLDSLVENIQDVVTLLDVDGRILWSSPSVHAVLGYDPARLVGRDALDLVHPEDAPAAAALLAEAASTPHHVASITYRFRHSDGSWRVMEAVGKSLLQHPAIGGIVINCRDVTERALAALAAMEASEAAERATRAKSEFLARTSHELRTPLNAILGFGQLLEMQLADADDRESARQIVRAGRHLLRLVGEVLEIAAIEAGRSALCVEPVPVQGALLEALDLLRPLADRQGVSLGAGHTEPAGLHVLADPQRLRQVLLNLVSNAIKYNVRGGSVRLEVEARGERLRISVHDTGVGIAADQLSRLFTPFERLGAAGTEIEGSGLGLALSRTLLEGMGGRIGVESTPGVGSEFWIELPAASAAAEEGPPAAGPGSGAGRVPPEVEGALLYIADSEADQRLVRRILSLRPRVRLVVATHAEGGSDFAARLSPDAILLHLDRVDPAGRAVLRRLRGHPRLREVPVAVVTADAVGAQKDGPGIAGAQALLTVPLDVAHLLAVVDSFLSQEAPPRGSGVSASTHSLPVGVSAIRGPAPA